MNKKAFALIAIAERQKAPTKFQDNVAGRVLLLVTSAHQLNACPDQENAENVENPVEALHQSHASSNEKPAHDQRSNYPPEQHRLFFFRRNFKVGKQKNKNKQVIDAKGFF